MTTYKIEHSFHITLNSTQYNIPELSLSDGDVAVIFSDALANCPMLMRLLGGALPRDETIVIPGPGHVKSKRHTLSAEEVPIVLNSKPLYGDNAAWRRVGMVFSEPDLNILGRTVLEDYLSAATALDTDGSYRESAILDLRPFGLSEKLTFRTVTLSEGEKQRLNCATAFLPNRKIFIGDFSTATLDLEFRLFLKERIRNFSENGGIVLLSGMDASDLSDISCTKTFYLASEGQKAILNEQTIDTAKFPDLLTQANMIATSLNPRKMGKLVLNAKSVKWRGITQPITLELYQGETVVLWGPNGSGKTTFGNLICGRIPARQRAGDLWTDDWIQPVMATQTPNEMVLGRTVLSELPDDELQSLCGLEPTQDGNLDPRGFSYGMKKLLGVANAIRLSKGLVVLDEPTTGMDWTQKQRLINLINSAPEHGILIITHDQALSAIERQEVIEVK